MEAQSSANVSDQMDGRPLKTAFFTICSKNFFAYARTLHASFQAHYPETAFFLALCDTLDNIRPDSEPFAIIPLHVLNIPDCEEMCQRYNITEFNTAIKPHVFLHLFKEQGFDAVVYLDPDILIVDRLVEVDQLLQAGAEMVLTPHILDPAEHVEFHDARFLRFGIYNLGFLAAAATTRVMEIMSWWARRLKRDCVIDLEQGLFVDQKWADLLPAFVSNTHVLRHPGYNVAYWNLSQRKVIRRGTTWEVNGKPLRFVHFSGHRLDTPEVFTRHCSEVTCQSIGDLKFLLDEFHKQIIHHGHEHFCKLPYAFNWDGQTGMNLHTPREIGQPASTQSSFKKTMHVSGLRHFIHSFTVARSMCGGIWKIIPGVWRSYRTGGWKKVMATYRELALLHGMEASLPGDETQVIPGLGMGRPTILFFDWGIPRPNQDAGSLFIHHLLRFFVRLGYDVTFLAGSLRGEKEYIAPLLNLGIHVLLYPQVTSIESFLREHAAKFEIIVLNRAPVAGPYINLIKVNAPKSKIIFNTIDLHYLREERQARVQQSSTGLAEALKTKQMELNLIKHSDVTILLSSEELYHVRAEIPDARLSTLALIHEPVQDSPPDLEQRQGLLFLGGFAHPPNVDAVLYFTREILPLIREHLPEITLHIVGASPPEEIQHLETIPGIFVHGFVSDLRPLFDSVLLSIAPLRFGAGMKGKVITSLSFGVPCVATPVAVEGTYLTHNQEVLIAEKPQAFAEAILKLCVQPELWHSLSKTGRKFIAQEHSPEAIFPRVNGILSSVLAGWPPMENLYEFRGRDAYIRHQGILGDIYQQRRAVEQACQLDHENERVLFGGYCAVCKTKVVFLSSFVHALQNQETGDKELNWREHIQCCSCGLINRVRAVIHALHTLCAPTSESRILLTEQTTTLYKWFSREYPRTVGSEFLGPGLAPGFINSAGIRHEDLTELSFADSSLDYILSLDVLEHVPNYHKALQEIHRCLATGGFFLFSVPFCYDRDEHVVRASLSPDGTIIHHLPPEIHGNPIDPKGGSLCYYYYGWKILDELRQIGFVRSRVLAYWSRGQGYLGREQYIFIAEKKSIR